MSPFFCFLPKVRNWPVCGLKNANYDQTETTEVTATSHSSGKTSKKAIHDIENTS